MSGVFSKPKTPKIPPPVSEPEAVETVVETAEEAKQKRRKRLVQGGRTSTVLSGIQSVLKKRLGE